MDKVSADSRIRVAHTCVLVLVALALVLLLLPLGLSDWLRVDVNRSRLYSALDTNDSQGNVDSALDALIWPQEDDDQVEVSEDSLDPRLTWLAAVNVDWRFFNRVRGLFYECVVPSVNDLRTGRKTPLRLYLSNLTSIQDDIVDDLRKIQKTVESKKKLVNFWECRSREYVYEQDGNSTGNSSHSHELRRAHRLELAATVCSILAPALVVLCLVLNFVSCCTGVCTAMVLTGLVAVLLLLAACVEAAGLASATVAHQLLTVTAPDSVLNRANWPQVLHTVIAYHTGAAMRLGWAALALLIIDFFVCLFFLNTVHNIHKENRATSFSTEPSGSGSSPCGECTDPPRVTVTDHDEAPLISSN